VKRELTGWEKIFANHVSDKRLISGIFFKNSFNSTIKNNQI